MPTLWLRATGILQPLLPKEHTPTLTRLASSKKAEAAVDGKGGGVFFQYFVGKIAPIPQRIARVRSSHLDDARLMPRVVEIGLNDSK